MREVTAAIIRRNGKILICRRAEGSCAHLWELPGGKTELGELSFVFIEAEIISGEPQLSVHEEMRWVLPNELTAFEWCPADRPVAEEISKSTEHTNNPLR